MQTAMIPFDDLNRMATAIHKAGMFGIKTPEQAIGLFLMAQAENMHPMTALRRFHIMSDGRAAMRSDAMLADFRVKAGGKVKWLRHDKEAAVGLWKVGDYELEIGFTMEEARQAGYVKPGSGWMKDPAAMLRARCISRAIRMMAPEIVAGLYAPEELSDGDWTAKADDGTLDQQKLTEAMAARAPAPAPVALALKPAAEPDTRTWKEIVGDKEPQALQHLVTLGWLKEGQPIESLKEAHVLRIRKNPTAFLAHAEKEFTTRQNNALNLEGATLTAAQKAVRDVMGGRA